MEKIETRRQRTVRSVEPTLRWRAPQRLRLTLFGIAISGATLVGALFVAFSPDPATALFTTLSTGNFGADRLAESGPFVAVLLVLLVLTGVGIYHGARTVILVRGWRLYLGGIAREVSEDLTRHARLQSLGYIPHARILRNQAPPGAAEPVATLLQVLPRILVVGENGAGKTVALKRFAAEIARSARIGKMITGRQLIPIYTTFPRYAQATPSKDGVRVEYLVAQVQRLGATMLARRLPLLLRRGRVALLLDGLDEIPSEVATTVLRELESGLRSTYRNLRVIIAGRTDHIAGIAEDAPLLKFLTQVELQSINADEMRQIVRRAGRAGQLGSRGPEAVLAEIEQRDSTQILTSPAFLAMLIDLLDAGEALPATRAAFIAAHERLFIHRAHLAPELSVLMHRSLGYLALAMRIAGIAELAGGRGWQERTAVEHLLEETGMTAATVRRQSRPIAQPDTSQIEVAIASALQVGIMERSPDGQSLRFRHMLFLFLAAARHLEVHDGGLGRISPVLLRPEWIEILILWGGMTEDPTGLAERLSRFAATPAGVAAVARIGEFERVEPLVHALALVVGVVSLTPMVTQSPADGAMQNRADLAQQHLRDLFDRVLRYGVDDQQEDRRLRLRTALRICERGSAGEMTPALARLVRSSLVNRIPRAQAVQILGLLASPAALGALTTLLLEQDPTVREALMRGFHLAGAEAADPLLNLIAAHPVGEVIHRRAIDAIAAVDGPAVAPALERLNATDSSGRAAAAEALGALRDRRALEPLLEATKAATIDVQLAAIRALGRLGDPKAQTTLLPLLQSTNEEVRIAAAESLGLMRGDRAIKPLIKLLDDARPKVRAAAAEALGHLGDIRAIDALRQHLSDRDGWAQAAAATALRALGQRA